MFKLFFIIQFVVFSITADAADFLKGLVVGEKSEPLIGAGIHWKNTSIGVVSDQDGKFQIPWEKSLKELEITYVGYAPQTIFVDSLSNFLTVQLKESIQLNEVLISTQRASTISSRITTIQTQKITYDELCRAACCNLAESFETNPSVDVSYSDAVTGAKQIRLLGLSGTYVQMLTENTPNFRGLAAPYGLDYVPGPWMESIQVSKGTSSVKNGYEAITGQINAEYKKPPTSDIISANVFAADNGRYEANADASIFLTNKLSTGLLLHYSNEEKEFDMNNDGFLDTPLKHQFNVMNRWYYRSEKFISQVGAKFLSEKRTGGQTDHSIPMDHTMTMYRTSMDVNRGEFFTKNGLILNPEKVESVALIFSGSYHDQNSIFGIRPYDAEQTNLYTSLIYEKHLTPRHRISTGASMNYDHFDERYNLFYTDPDIVYIKEPEFPKAKYENTKETTTGAYFEYTFNKDDKLVILAGLRADYSSLHKIFITPRLHVKYDFTDWFQARASVGKGYRTTQVLPENNFYLASSRSFNIANNLDQEEAWNYGANLSFYLPIAGKTLTLNTEWYYTKFLKQVVADVDTDPHQVSFYNLNGKSYSSSMQVEATYPFFRGFTLTAAYRLMDVKTTYNGVLMKKALTDKYKGLITASYQTPLRKWQFDITSQFNGSGRMPLPDKNTPLWDNTYGSYVILNAQISKFFRTWSIYAGSENILDFVQERPIIAPDKPWNENFDATMVWGPVHGRKLYVGLRWNIPRL